MIPYFDLGLSRQTSRASRLLHGPVGPSPHLLVLLILLVALLLLILKISAPCLYHYNYFSIVLNDTGSSRSILLNGVGICVARFHRPLHLSPETAHLLSSLHLPPSSLHVRRSPCAEMTGFSQRYDTFGSLFSPSRSLFLSRRADGPRLPLAV